MGRKGRPRAGEIPWDEIERLAVHGETSFDGRRVIPTNRDLARRFGVSEEVMSRRSTSRNWIAKREVFSATLAEKVQAKVISKMSIDLFARIKRRAEIGDRITAQVEAALTGQLPRELPELDPLDLLRLQQTLKAQAETDRADLALDPKRGASEGPEESTDSTMDALVDAVMGGVFEQNQAPAEGAAGFDGDRD